MLSADAVRTVGELCTGLSVEVVPDEPELP
jgi:hypothetical protein